MRSLPKQRSSTRGLARNGRQHIIGNTDMDYFSTPRAESETDVEPVPESDSEYTSEHDLRSEIGGEASARSRSDSVSTSFSQGTASSHHRLLPAHSSRSPDEPVPQISRRRGPPVSAGFPYQSHSYGAPTSTSNSKATGTQETDILYNLSTIKPRTTPRHQTAGPASESGLPMLLPTIDISIPNRETRSEPDVLADSESYDIGAYGYRYPAHPPYTSQSQTITPTASSSVPLSDVYHYTSESPPALVPAHAPASTHINQQHVPLAHAQMSSQPMNVNYTQPQSWGSFVSASSASPQSNSTVDSSESGSSWNPPDANMDVDVGGWGKVSDPLPGMQIEMHEPAIYSHEPARVPDTQLYEHNQVPFTGSAMSYPQQETKISANMMQSVGGYDTQQSQQMGYYGSNSQPMSWPK